MAQHDYVLADQAGLAFLSDTNAALAAIVSQNSGATEPATMYAYQLWADTTTGKLKIRNAANDGWIIWGDLAKAGLGAVLDDGTVPMTGLLTMAASADIASAATIDLTAADGNTTRITGTDATSAFTMTAGQWHMCIADGAWPLTYHATTNKLNTGGSNYTCAAGDRVLLHKDDDNIIHATVFPTASALTAASRAEMEAGTEEALRLMSPLRVAQAIAARSMASIPPGSVLWFAANTAPTGYLKANGAAVSRTTYAALFTAIGTTFGSGDGSTTFNVPDLRGEFIRGWDDSRGVDSGRAFGSAQSDVFKSHTHGQGFGSGAFFGATGSGSYAPGSTTATGGTETRPRNIALLACIKY